MSKDPRHQQMALACRYLSGTGMAAREAVRAEVYDLLEKLPAFPGITMALVGADDIELLKAFEARHGVEAWKDFAFFEKTQPAQVEGMGLSTKVRAHVYDRAMASRPQALEACYIQLLLLGATIGSRPYISALLAARAPSQAETIKLLSEGRLIESSALRKEIVAHLSCLSGLALDKNEAMSLSINLAARALPRSFALLAKEGLAVEVPDTLIRSCASPIIKRMNAQLASNHGRMRLMERLPDARALLRPAEKQLEKNIEKALAA